MEKKNFYLENDENRFNEYLYRCIYKYLTNYSIYNYIFERKLDNTNTYAGIFTNNDNIACIIPKRKNLYDEMVGIYELTQLVNILSSNQNLNSEYDGVVPSFNVYNYLKSISDDLASDYENYKYNLLNKSNNPMNDLYAYSSLVRRKKDYDIDELNKINCSDVDLKRELKLKGYIK